LQREIASAGFDKLLLGVENQRSGDGNLTGRAPVGRLGDKVLINAEEY